MDYELWAIALDHGSRSLCAEHMTQICPYLQNATLQVKQYRALSSHHHCRYLTADNAPTDNSKPTEALCVKSLCCDSHCFR